LLTTVGALEFFFARRAHNGFVDLTPIQRFQARTALLMQTEFNLITVNLLRTRRLKSPFPKPGLITLRLVKHRLWLQILLFLYQLFHLVRLLVTNLSQVHRSPDSLEIIFPAFFLHVLEVFLLAPGICLDLQLFFHGVVDVIGHFEVSVLIAGL
jgi:hypothetical protein